MKYLLLLFAVMLFLLPCDAKYKVTWEETYTVLDTDTTTSAWPYRNVTKTKCFDKPIEAQDFKKTLPTDAMASYSLVKDEKECPSKEVETSVEGFIIETVKDTDTTGH